MKTPSTKIGKCMLCGTEIAVSKYTANRTLCHSCRKERKLLHDSYAYKKDINSRTVSVCEFCNKQYFKTHRKQRFCSHKCSSEFRKKKHIESVEKAGEFDKQLFGEASRKFVRTYLIEKYGERCSICGIAEWMGKPAPLIVDHIDGNAFNRKIDNFRLVCANCDAQLPTYKNKNRGKGRAARYNHQWFRTLNTPVSPN